MVFEDPEERTRSVELWEAVVNSEGAKSYPLHITGHPAAHIPKSCQPLCFLGEASIPQARGTKPFPAVNNSWKQLASKYDMRVSQEDGDKV